MSSNIYRRGKTWWGRIQFHGQEYRRSLQTTSRTIAEKRVKDWIGDLQAQEWGEKPAPRFEDAVVHFFEVSGGLKPATLRRYQSSLRLLNPFLAGLRLSEITRDKLREFTAHRQRGGAATPTIRRDLAFLSSVFSEAATHWEFDGNPVLSFLKAGRKRKTLRDSERRTRYLTENEEAQLLAACEPSLAFAVVFAIDTGLRREEQFGMCWSDIDMRQSILTVQGDRTKTHTTRQVPLLPRTAQMLAQQPRRLRLAGEADFIFCKPNGQRYPHRRQAFETAVKASGLEDVVWHDLRRTCGCRLLRSHGMTKDRVGQWLGHGSVVTTERHYAFLNVEDLKQAAQIPAQKQRFKGGK